MGGFNNVGPVTFPFPPGFSRPPVQGGGQVAAGSPVETRFHWATVVNPSPLSIQLDGDTTPLPLVPDTLVDPTGLLPYSRVWVQLQGRNVIVLGMAGGDVSWVDVSINSGFAKRPDDQWGAGFDPQVMLDSSGMVHFKGMMSNTGMASLTGIQTPIMTMPDGYWPESEQFWSGFIGTDPTDVVGGWISPNDGQLFYYGTKAPAAWWCLLIPAYKPMPAAPY
jgi:hypothetical protein